MDGQPSILRRAGPLMVARLAIEAHGHSRTAAIACGAAAAVALCWPRVWRALGTRLLERGLLAICVLVVACLPFFVSGNPGILSFVRGRFFSLSVRRARSGGYPASAGAARQWVSS